MECNAAEEEEGDAEVSTVHTRSPKLPRIPPWKDSRYCCYWEKNSCKVIKDAVKIYFSISEWPRY